VNYRIQGEAARLMKNAMIECDEYLESLGDYGHCCMTIHDELIFEFPEKQRPKKVLRNLRDIMEDHGGRYGVATPVEFSKATDNWAEKVPVTW
jgi:DNA polymerase I-like protein with 3'-5' exonuclease and polymerase domains